MWAAIVTALAAAVVFVVTQTFLKLVLEPIQEQRKLIGETVYALTFYEKAFTLRVDREYGEPAFFGASPEEAKEAQKGLRELAGKLRAGLWSLPSNRVYDVCAKLHLVHKRERENVVEAANELHMWYSQLHAPVNHHQHDAIRECQASIAMRLGIEQRAPLPPSEEEVPGSNS